MKKQLHCFGHPDAHPCLRYRLAEPYPLDVIIAEYGPNTREWFLGAADGMGNGKNFVQAFEEANPDVKLNLEVVS